jgi:hypothetical protein
MFDRNKKSRIFPMFVDIGDESSVDNELLDVRNVEIEEKLSV